MRGGLPRRRVPDAAQRRQQDEAFNGSTTGGKTIEDVEDKRVDPIVGDDEQRLRCPGVLGGHIGGQAGRMRDPG